MIKLEYEQNRIYSQDKNGKLIAEVTFPKVDESTVDIDHTFVDSSLRGQGVADVIMNAAVSKIEAAGLKTKTSCPYAEKWFKSHPEKAEILAD